MKIPTLLTKVSAAALAVSVALLSSFTITRSRVGDKARRTLAWRAKVSPRDFDLERELPPEIDWL
ncbi:MAG: hypothetical protein M3O09_01225 [Acidobacteriota bacterium]|nr:hypothetical protein [Acidobacteriota bacterium]